MHSKRITRERLASMKSRRDVLVADVRTPECFRDASIKDSMNLYPIRNFVNQLQRIQNKKQPIVIVSHTTDDEDAAVSERYAQTLGFENIFINDFKSLRED